jgi:hypothetical protein
VTKNLVEALKYLKLPEQPRVLWTDAICISQQDLVEKGKQVERMASICKSAARMVVWLGPESELTTLGMRTLSNLSSTIQVDFLQSFMTPVLGQDHSWAEKSIQLPFDEMTWSAVNAVISAPWFQRL